MEFNKKIIEEGLNQVLAIARARTRILELLKQALIDNDDNKIKDYARQLCGLNK